MGKHAEHDGKSGEDEEQHGEKHHEGIAEKLEHGWQHLEDLTGGRAHILRAGDQQESNFENIEHHQDAEHH